MANAHANRISGLADEAIDRLKVDILDVVNRLRGYLKQQLAGAKVDADGRLVDDRINAELAAKLEADMGRVLTGLGYDSSVHRVLGSFEAVVEANDALLGDQLGASLSSANRESLGAFVNGVVDQLLRYKGEAGAALRKAMLLGANSHVPLDKEIDELARAAEVTLGQATNEVDTAIMAFHREALATGAEEAGFDLFQYVGPDDSLTRPFCAAHVDRIYTTGDLDEEDNGQGLEPTSRFLGGFRCRHSLAPITVEEARQLAKGDAKIIGGREARRIVLGDAIGTNEAAFVAENTGRVVTRSGRSTVVRRRRRAA